MNNETIKYLVNLISQNNKCIDNNNISLISQNPMNQLSLLQKKRFLSIQNLNNNNKNLLQENNNFPLLNNCILNEYGPNLAFYSQLTNPSFFYDNNSNLNNLELNKFSHVCPNPLIKENRIENIFINNNINNVNYNLNGNQLNNIFFNNFIDNNKENYKYNKNNYANINDNVNVNINNNPNDISKLNDSNNSSVLSSKPFMKKKVFFKVTKNEKTKKKVFRKYIKQAENNNEIKVLKNHKVVYVNTFLLKSYSTSKNIKKFNKIAFFGRNKRSSRFRGVSKNGNQWQVLMMINNNKSYIGSYPSEELAARIYDILSLKNRGMKARTNFKYTSQQIKNICEIDIDIKSKNIYEIISQLIV